MTLLGSLGQALQRLDRRLSGRPITPQITSGSIPLANGRGQQMLISHDEAVQGNPTVFGVWERVVQELATTGVYVEQRQQDGSWQRATDTPVDELLAAPAAGLGLTDTLQWIFNPWLTEGNALIVPVYDDPAAPPTGLVPLDWRFMTAWAMPGGPVQLWASTQAGTEPVPFLPSELVHFSWHPPTAGGIGVAPLTALKTAVQVDDAASRLLSAQYNNGLHFGGFLSFPKDMTADQMPSDEDIEKMKQQWRETYGGVDSAFAVAVLKGGLQFDKVSMTVAEAEILNARNVVSDDVYRAFGFRRSDFEDVDGVDIEHRQRSLHRGLIRWTRRAEDCFTAQLLRRTPAWSGYRLRFDLTELLKGTYREELETAVYAFTNGMTTRNESRASVGLTSLDDAESNKVFVPHAQLNPGTDGRTQPASAADTGSRQTREIPGAGGTTA